MVKIQQAVILIEENSSKMFPFDTNSISEISIGNVVNIKMIVDKIRQVGIKKIVVVGNNLDFEQNALRNLEDIEFLQTGSKVGDTLASIVETGDTLVHSNSSYVDPEDLSKLLSDSNTRNNRVLLELNTKNTFNYKDYICAKANNFVDCFYAHPRASYVNSRSAGVYLIRQEYSDYLKNASYDFKNVNVGVITKEGYYIEQIFNDVIEDGHRIEAEFCEHGYVSLRFAWDILEANYYETTKIVDGITMGENSYVDDSVIFEGSAHIGKNTSITNGAIIGDGAIVGDNVVITNYAKVSKNTVIGHRNKIGYTAEVTGVTFTNTAIVHNSHICGLIGRNVDIGAGTNTANLRFDDLSETIKVENRRYSNKYTSHVYIGNNSRTGVGSLIAPGTRIGQNSAIGSGVLVTGDVKEDSLLLVKQEQVIKDWGSNKHGW